MTRQLDYSRQKRANIGAFTHSFEYSRRLRVLTAIAYHFAKAKIKWALTCSLLLFFHGIVDDSHDIDIVIAPDDVEKAFSILSSLGKRQPEPPESRAKFFRDYAFASFVIADVEVDAISEFGAVAYGTEYYYKYCFCEDDLEFMEIGEQSIPLVPVESQYLLYAMMCAWQDQRRFKRDLIYSYLGNGNVRHPNVLKDALNASITDELRQSIYPLLEMD